MIQWTAPEFHYHEKNEAWPAFIVLGAFVIGLLALWQNNFLFLIFTIIATCMVLVWGRRRPRIITCRVDEKGITIGREQYVYHALTGFALRDALVQLHFKRRFHTQMNIAVPPRQARDIHKHLLAFLPEVEYTESFIEAIGHLLKF